jgi:hypothetical protein
MLGMESQYTAIVELLLSLRNRYSHMIRAAGTADTMTTGKLTWDIRVVMQQIQPHDQSCWNS